MSGFSFRGGGGGFRGRPHHNVSDPPLIKLVEDYLCENSHMSFINLEHMGELIRKKSHRFLRMKQAVFKEQLRKAYQFYCESANRKNDELSGADIVIDNTPLTDETLREMEGYPSEDDVSSLEEEDLGVTNKDSGLDLMKNLYTPKPMPVSSNSSPAKIGKNDARTNNAKHADDEDILRNLPNNLDAECVSVGSSLTDFSVKSESRNKPTDKEAEKKEACIENHEDSESDLEIIEEVQLQHDKCLNSGGLIGNGVSITPIPNCRNPPAPNQPTPKAPQQQSADQHRIAISKGSSSAVTPSKAEKTRGTKRKPAGSDIESTSSGINEDYGRKRPKKEVAIIHNTGYKLEDFAGSDKAVEEICKLLMHLKHPEIYQTLGVTPPRGFLLHGPPGTGKTLLASAIAGELQMPMLKMAGTEFVSGISGESESNIRELFSQAVAAAPCIVFIDEIDSVTPRRENVNKEMERRIVAQLLSCIDELMNKEKGNQVLLIGATNRIEAIDTALRRAGRFDREICLGIPDEKSREKILNVICRNLKLASQFQLGMLARLTPGYVGADLQSLIREAAVQAVNRKLLTEDPEKTQPMESNSSSGMDVDVESGELPVLTPASENEKEVIEAPANQTDLRPHSSDPMRWIKETAPLTSNELNDLYITMKDFEFALKNVQPSSKREGFATVPDITWDDIGALKDVRDELQVSILGPVKHAEAFKKLGLTTPAGVLLCGPPGCGKTLLAKAVANEAGINFISVKGPELLNMYVGESERAVRQCFLRARNSSPCVIFFDELDALCPRRSEVADSGSSGRIVNQLLTEMDGMEARKGVFVMAATNRPDIIDPAVLRPGRLDKILFVNLPTPTDRFEILTAITKNSTNPVLDSDINMEEIANCSECEYYTGADLAALVREASIAAFRELILNPTQENGTLTSVNDLKVSRRHFTTAFTKTKPSVGENDRLKYKKMAEMYSSIK